MGTVLCPVCDNSTQAAASRPADLINGLYEYTSKSEQEAQVAIKVCIQPKLPAGSGWQGRSTIGTGRTQQQHAMLLGHGQEC